MSLIVGLTRDVQAIDVGLHETKHVDELVERRLGVFRETVIHFASSSGDRLPLAENPFGSITSVHASSMDRLGSLFKVGVRPSC
jgi:hypothetical protein